VKKSLVERLYRQAKADRWQLPVDRFEAALKASADRAFAGKSPDAPEVERYVGSLHLDDLALACACAAGHEAAWEQFIFEQRPLLYRSADALDPSGGAREIPDSLYADLYGLQNREGEGRSLFRYFHGRSSLATWLRAVLAQRHVDRLRTERRLAPLPDEESPATIPASPPPDADRPRYLTLIRDALGRAEAAGEPAVFVEGIPGYYPRFGFEPAIALGFISPDPAIPDEAFLIKRLAGYSPDLGGRIVYPAAFDALGS